MVVAPLSRVLSDRNAGRAKRWTAAALVIALACPASLCLGQTPTEPGSEELLAPTDLAVCQTDYGDAPAVELNWTNPEMYESVEFAVDGDDVFGEGMDGADGVGIVPASAGSRVFGVRGRLGDRISAWSTIEFDVLDESPVPTPIVDLDCEFIPVDGGLLRVSWSPGSDAWDVGRVGYGDGDGVPRIGDFEVVEGGATEAEILVPLDRPGVGVVLAFKDGDGYFSPPFTPPCEQRLPVLRRGDCNNDGRVNISDSIYNLNHLFIDGPRGFCDDACDSNDDGALDLSDSIATLDYLFLGTGPLPAPGPVACGMDPTEDFLGGICACPEPVE